MEPRINRLCGRGKNTNPQHLKQHSQTCRKGKEMAITHLIVGIKAFVDYNNDIEAYARGTAEEHYANGYERTVDTLYANCMGIKEGSKWMDAFRKKYDEGQFSFCVKEGDTYWFAMWASNSLKNLRWWHPIRSITQREDVISRLNTMLTSTSRA